MLTYVRAHTHKHTRARTKPVIFISFWVIKNRLNFKCFAANCYKRIMSETKEMQNKIADKLGLNPVENEVVVLYDGERDKVFSN